MPKTKAANTLRPSAPVERLVRLLMKVSMMKSELIDRLLLQAKEIENDGHAGWGKTMLDAAQKLKECQDAMQTFSTTKCQNNMIKNDVNTELTPTPPDRSRARCYTCKYWDGDKDKVHVAMAENPLCMDLFEGSPETGNCKIDYEWQELTIITNCNTLVTLRVPANFGCPYWGPG